MFHVKKRLNLNCIDISMLLPSFYENQIFQSIDLKKIGLLKKDSVINFVFDVIFTLFFLNYQKLILRIFFEFDEKSVPLT